MPRFSLSRSINRGALSFEMCSITIREVVSMTDPNDIVAIAIKWLPYAIKAEPAADDHIGRTISDTNRSHETAAAAEHLCFSPCARLTCDQWIFAHPIRDTFPKRSLQDGRAGTAARDLCLDRFWSRRHIDRTRLPGVKAAGLHLSTLMCQVGSDLDVEQISALYQRERSS